MLLDKILMAYELIDDPRASGEAIAAKFREFDHHMDIEVRTVDGDKGSMDFVKLYIPGCDGISKGGNAPTLGVIGMLGGVGARPGRIGAVSDADGAIISIAIGLKLVDMLNKKEALKGDVIITTHICPAAPQVQHDPVAFMSAPVDMETVIRLMVDQRMEAILSIDATKGNEVINNSGFAISPTVKEGYILRVSKDLLKLMRFVTGEPPIVFPITIQDITPYGNGLHHLNTIMQPSTATASPVVGVATISKEIVPGIATGANYPIPLEMTSRYCIEVAKEFGEGTCQFYEKKEFRRIIDLYGSLKRFQTLGKGGDS